MLDLDAIIADAYEQLAKHRKLRNPTITHLIDRYFSKIYEIRGEEQGRHQSYILKISTTHRSCENEYNQYIYLKDKNIKSLVPIFYSSEHNYLITVKEDLIEFENYLRNNRSDEFHENCFFELGKLFNKIDKKTGEYDIFCKSEFNDYVLPRIENLNVFSKREKEIVKSFIERVTSESNGMNTRTCFVSDFSLSNIHVNKHDEIVLLDMGDAYHGNIHENLTYIYLNIKFGELSKYLERKINMKLYNEFIKGYKPQKKSNELFLLFQIKHLINMLHFISSLKPSSKNAARRLLSHSSNKYLLIKYKRYLFKLIND